MRLWDCFCFLRILHHSNKKKGQSKNFESYLHKCTTGQMEMRKQVLDETIEKKDKDKLVPKLWLESDKGHQKMLVSLRLYTTFYML